MMLSEGGERKKAFGMSKPLACAAFAQKSGSTLKLTPGGSDWAEGKPESASNHGDSDSDLTEGELFIAKGAFLLTPSYELSIEKASSICEKMNFKSSFSLTKTATGILFKFENPEDYQAVFKKGFHKVTGARFYKKIPIPCRPQKTFTVFVYDVPDDIPEEDLRHALYKFHSVVELTRLPLTDPNPAPKPDTAPPPPRPDKPPFDPPTPAPAPSPSPPPPVRVTLASLHEATLLLDNGLDFYGATFFPTDAAAPAAPAATAPGDHRRPHRLRSSLDYSALGPRLHHLLPVFDAAGFLKIPPPAIKTFRPPAARQREFGKK